MDDGIPHFAVERCIMARGLEVLMAYQSNFPFPVSYLFFTESGEDGSTRMRADIIEMYTPEAARGNGAATALVKHLQTQVNAIHTVTASPGASVVLTRCGFFYDEATMDWRWGQDCLALPQPEREVTS